MQTPAHGLRGAGADSILLDEHQATPADAPRELILPGGIDREPAEDAPSTRPPAEPLVSAQAADDVREQIRAKVLRLQRTREDAMLSYGAARTRGLRRLFTSRRGQLPAGILMQYSDFGFACIEPPVGYRETADALVDEIMRPLLEPVAA